MEDIFHLIRDGNALAVRLWLDTIENDFNQGDDHGFSLLHWACWDGRLNIVEMLLQRGAKINATNKCDDTPLHCATQNNHLDVVCCLIKNKANINLSNLHGNTALHYACHFAYTDIVFELLRNGALIMICNRYDQTPIDLCKKPLRESLLNYAKSNFFDLARIPFREDQNWRWSRSKSRDATFSNQCGINIDDLPVEKMIESNHGGTTWKGFWQDSEVIIKVLKLKETTQRIASNFNQEYKKLRIFNSANILPVLGACISLPDLIIVSQYMPYGSLFNLLHDQNEFIVDSFQAVNLAINIAKGMEFLHNLDPPLYNFHLNSKHVMIDEDLVAKINMGDYRFSFFDNRKIYDPAWMAPEALKKKPEDVNKKSADMWSFAIILWELNSREIPFGNLSPIQCGLKIARDSMRIKLSIEISSHVQKLIKICMNEDASKRPKFEMIIPILEKLKNTTHAQPN